MSTKDERIDIKESNLVIVEGRDEQLFFEAALQNHLGLTGIQVMPIGGKKRLTRSLEILVNDVQFPMISSLAILRDADTPFGDAPAASTATTEAIKAFQSGATRLTARL